MKFTLFVAGFFVFILGSTSGYYGPMTNKTPKVENGWTDACDECQTIIKRLVQVAKDPTKVSELKILLSMLCRETHYEAECRLFVSKLDIFLERLLPYLQDAHHVCQELRMCGNRRLQQFHRVGLLFARKIADKTEAKNSLICEECQFAARELLTLVDDPNVQQQVQDWLEENACARMGTYKDMCDQYLEEFLPQLWQELHAELADSKKFCEQLELCPQSASFAQGDDGEQKSEPGRPSSNRSSSILGTLNEFTRGKEASIPCQDCRTLVRMSRDGLSKNKTVYYMAEKLGKVCRRVPLQLRDGCQGFLEMYSPAIVYMSVQHFLDDNVCHRLRLCGLMKCEACLAASEFVEMEIGRPEVQAELIEVLEKEVCDQVPSSWYPICDNLVKSTIPLEITQLLKKYRGGKICYLIKACKEAHIDFS